MRILSEYIIDKNQILLRLVATLGDLDFGIPPSPIQLGEYIIDGTPRLPQIQTFEVTEDLIVENEVQIYFTGYYPPPALLKITRPDLAVLSVPVGVVRKEAEPILANQPDDIFTPEEKPEHQPAKNDFKKETMAPPQLPSCWIKLDFTLSNPVLLEDRVSSDPIVYLGGVEGRALSSSQRQLSVDSAPYMQGQPTKLEGAYINVLEQSTFEPTSQRNGFFDPIPDGWNIELADPGAMLRVETEHLGQTLPVMTLVYHQNPDGTFVPNAPVTIMTPPVPDFHSFQIIADAGIDNAVGNLRLVSENGMVSTPQSPLTDARILRLDVGPNGGRVRILWEQTNGLADFQVLKLAAPLVSTYETEHCWTPFNEPNVPDFIQVPNIQSPLFSLCSGSVKVDSLVESLGEPLSWSIVSSHSGEVILELADNELKSDFSSSIIADFDDFLPGIIADSGFYEIRWTDESTFVVVHKAQPQGLSLPFEFNLPIPDAVLQAPFKLEFRSCSVVKGTATLLGFCFGPKSI